MNREPAPSHAGGHSTQALVDLLDQIIDSGAVAVGDVLLSVADIDLVHVELRLALKGIDGQHSHPAGVDPHRHRSADPPAGTPAGPPPGAPASGPDYARRAPDRPAGNGAAQRDGGRRDDADPEQVQRGVAALVLTLVDVLRELMERQAVRRMESGSLVDHDVERLGQTFLALRQRMEDLKDSFGVRSA